MKYLIARVLYPVARWVLNVYYENKPHMAIPLWVETEKFLSDRFTVEELTECAELWEKVVDEKDEAI